LLVVGPAGLEPLQACTGLMRLDRSEVVPRRPRLAAGQFLHHPLIQRHTLLGSFDGQLLVQGARRAHEKLAAVMPLRQRRRRRRCALRDATHVLGDHPLDAGTRLRCRRRLPRKHVRDFDAPAEILVALRRPFGTVGVVIHVDAPRSTRLHAKRYQMRYRDITHAIAFQKRHTAPNPSGGPCAQRRR
jgi:hypothetical protein